MDIDCEIDRLHSILEVHNKAFSERSAAIYDRIEDLEDKLNRKVSVGRRHAIVTKIDFYENELLKLHQSIEVLTRDINFKINKLTEHRKKNELKKQSLDHNIEYLKKAINNKDTSEIYEMFESLLNCVEILKNKQSE